MPIERRLDAETQVLHTTITGVVSMREMREHFTEVYAMGGQKYPELIDSRGVTGLDFGARDLPGLADLGRRLFGEAGYTAPRAVIVTGVMYFGMARLFSSFAAPWVRIAVFEHPAAAEGWLDHVMRMAQGSR
jgi:hypothetical protein